MNESEVHIKITSRYAVNNPFISVKDLFQFAKIIIFLCAFHVAQRNFCTPNTRISLLSIAVHVQMRELFSPGSIAFEETALKYHCI